MRGWRESGIPTDPNYPEVAQKLRMHLEETNRQEERIDEILHALGEDRSLLKDWATQITGNMAAVAHVPMADEILKDTFANHAFEAFEIAAYKSLITMAEARRNTCSKFFRRRRRQMPRRP